MVIYCRCSWVFISTSIARNILVMRGSSYIELLFHRKKNALSFPTIDVIKLTRVWYLTTERTKDYLLGSLRQCWQTSSILPNLRRLYLRTWTQYEDVGNIIEITKNFLLKLQNKEGECILIISYKIQDTNIKDFYSCKFSPWVRVFFMWRVVKGWTATLPPLK